MDRFHNLAEKHNRKICTCIQKPDTQQNLQNGLGKKKTVCLISSAALNRSAQKGKKNEKDSYPMLENKIIFS
jgi:hypothetical protein